MKSALFTFSLFVFAFAATAANYGTLVGGDLVRAPYTVKTDAGTAVTASLDEATANRSGFKLVEDFPPACASNEYAVATGWAETNRIYRTYEKNSVVAPPRVYYRYDVSQACYENGFLDSLIQYIESDPYIKWFWNCSNKVEETNPLFIEATNKVIKAGVDEKLVRRILDRAYELGQTTSAELN